MVRETQYSTYLVSSEVLSVFFRRFRKSIAGVLSSSRQSPVNAVMILLVESGALYCVSGVSAYMRTYLFKTDFLTNLDHLSFVALHTTSLWYHWRRIQYDPYSVRCMFLRLHVPRS